MSGCGTVAALGSDTDEVSCRLAVLDTACSSLEIKCDLIDGAGVARDVGLACLGASANTRSTTPRGIPPLMDKSCSLFT